MENARVFVGLLPSTEEAGKEETKKGDGSDQENNNIGKIDDRKGVEAEDFELAGELAVVFDAKNNTNEASEKGNEEWQGVSGEGKKQGKCGERQGADKSRLVDRWTLAVGLVRIGGGRHIIYYMPG